MDDLRAYKVVQRAFLGATTRNVTSDMLSKYQLFSTNGVYVDFVRRNSSAMDAGIRVGDVITEINGKPVNSVPELQEKEALFRPGDRIAITVIRQKRFLYLQSVLKNIKQNTSLMRKPDDELRSLLGGEFEEITLNEAAMLGLKSGVRLTRLYPNGPLKMNTQVKEGFIVTRVNNNLIKDMQEFYNYIKATRPGDSVMIEGVYPNGRFRTVYAFSL